jgi:galactokinase
MNLRIQYERDTPTELDLEFRKRRGVKILVANGEVVKCSDAEEYSKRKNIFDEAMKSLPKPQKVRQLWPKKIQK